MWVMAASPLLTCTDVRKMSPFLKEILMNEDVLAVHKDPLARMATRIDVGGGLHELTSSGLCRNDFPVCQEYDSCTHCTNNVSVWAKPLASGETAVMIMNRDNHSIASAAVLLPDIGDGMLATFSARDLWAQQDLGVHSNAISLAVPAHGIRLLKLTPPRPPAPTPPRVCPPGFTNHAAGYWANLEPCNACPHDGQNATGSLCGAKCEKTMGCKGFEVYAGPDGPPACFIFVGELAPPFTANAGCLTCVKEAAAEGAKEGRRLAEKADDEQERPMSTTSGFGWANGTFLLDGEPFRVLGGSLQHFRTPPAHWEHRLDLLVAMGLNAVQTLIPWNQMEPTPGAFAADGFLDIVRFVQLCAARGLKVVLRPGPFICDGPDLGGIPWWLASTRTRAADPVFLAAATRFYTKLFALLRAQRLTADLGGPIIMAQVDNEYGIFGADKVYLGYIRDVSLRQHHRHCPLTREHSTALL
jgi:hypothetical protein